MNNFNYYTPTQIVFGKDSENQIGSLIKAQKCNNVLIHYGGHSAIKSGLLQRICDLLKHEKITYELLGGVVPNPRLSKVQEGIGLCREKAIDFILAIGGGSVIDSAKAIGYGYYYDGNVWDIYEKKAAPTNCLPIGAVLTIAASGSEMSDSSVITNEDGWLKRGYSSNLCRCKFAVLNPELTYCLPQYQTACGCVDIIMHTLERFFSSVTTMEITDRIAVGLIKTVIHNSPILMQKPDDYNARAEIMWAGSLSHNGLTGCGAGGGDWACHQMEHELGGMFDVAHGAGLSAIWGSWAKYVYTENPARFAALATEVFDVNAGEKTIDELAVIGIDKMIEFFKSINMPTTIRELGVELNDAQRKELAYKCTFMGKRNIGGFKILNEQDIIHIYEMATE